MHCFCPMNSARGTGKKKKKRRRRRRNAKRELWTWDPNVYLITTRCIFFFFLFINVIVSVYLLSGLFLDYICLLYSNWLLRKCGKERKFSSIGKCVLYCCNFVTSKLFLLILYNMPSCCLLHSGFDDKAII